MRLTAHDPKVMKLPYQCRWLLGRLEERKGEPVRWRELLEAMPVVRAAGPRSPAHLRVIVFKLRGALPPKSLLCDRKAGYYLSESYLRSAGIIDDLPEM